jgi:hypothetical protein
MGTVANDGNGHPARPDATQAARLLRLRALGLWAWLTGTGYRPERHYMRGGGTNDASGPQPRPA